MHDGKRDSRVGQQICKGSSNQKGYRKNYDDIMALPTLQGSYSYEKKKPYNPPACETKKAESIQVYSTKAETKNIKRYRSSFSTDQLRRMEDTFRHRPYLSTSQVEELAGSLKLSNRQVKIWFQNRRTKLKKQVTPNQHMPGPNVAASGHRVSPSDTQVLSQYLCYLQKNDTLAATLNRYANMRM